MFGLNEDQLLRLVYLMALLAFVGGGLAFSRGRIGARLKHLAIWALIALGLVTLYAYREPFQRFAAPVLQELNPSRAVEMVNADGSSDLVLARGPDGHFQIDAEANGIAVRFLVDTGATSTVLTTSDAERVGIDTATLSFDRPVQTANGLAYSARARLDSLEIGPFRISNVPVGVMAENTLGISLLGMNTLDRFGSVRMQGDRMTLSP